MEAYGERSLGTAEIDGAKTCSSEALRNDVIEALPTGLYRLLDYNYRFPASKGSTTDFWYDILDNVSFNAKVLALSPLSWDPTSLPRSFLACSFRDALKRQSGGWQESMQVVDRCWPLTPPIKCWFWIFGVEEWKATMTSPGFNWVDWEKGFVPLQVSSLVVSVSCALHSPLTTRCCISTFIGSRSEFDHLVVRHGRELIRPRWSPSWPREDRPETARTRPPPED